ncbi:hypothetical protein BH11ARM2_BH11ARM2_10730 [soil metagenome]
MSKSLAKSSKTSTVLVAPGMAEATRATTYAIVAPSAEASMAVPEERTQEEDLRSIGSLASEAAISKYWDRPGEDEAWQGL